MVQISVQQQHVCRVSNAIKGASSVLRSSDTVAAAHSAICDAQGRVRVRIDPTRSVFPSHRGTRHGEEGPGTLFSRFCMPSCRSMAMAIASEQLCHFLDSASPGPAYSLLRYSVVVCRVTLTRDCHCVWETCESSVRETS